MDRTITVKVDPKLHPRDWGRTLGTIAVVVGIVGSLLGIILALQAFFRRRRSTGRDVEP
jgi:flagellar motor component MotA